MLWVLGLFGMGHAPIRSFHKDLPRCSSKRVNSSPKDIWVFIPRELQGKALQANESKSLGNALKIIHVVIIWISFKFELIL